MKNSKARRKSTEGKKQSCGKVKIEEVISPTEAVVSVIVEEEKKEDQSVPEKEDTLNLLQERFCQLFATDREFFGNGVQTYLEVYDIDKSKPNWYKTACVCASQLLSNPKVCQRINELIEEGGLNDQHVDKQLYLLVTQDADYKSKNMAIREYNRLKKRVDDKPQVNVNLSFKDLLNDIGTRRQGESSPIV